MNEARSRFFLIDRPGLLHDGIAGLRPFQQRFVQPKDRVEGWRTSSGEAIGLLDVVRNARPTILIGVSGQPGTFTEEIVRTMAELSTVPSSSRSRTPRHDPRQARPT